MNVVYLTFMKYKSILHVHTILTYILFSIICSISILSTVNVNTKYVQTR
jgi:hypothetical protein